VKTTFETKIAIPSADTEAFPTYKKFVSIDLLNLRTEFRAEARKRGEIQTPGKKGCSISNIRVSAPPRDAPF
jgi:hypothetical protein